MGHEGHDRGHVHGGTHEHPRGLRGVLHDVVVPHSHDAADAVDDALESSARGIRAVKVSLVVLGTTALAQLAIVAVSGSVALLADTVHNFADALTAVPLWVAFALGRRAATRRHSYGFGRAEDLAGLFVVAMIALSALVAGVESVHRLIEPQPVDRLEWVIAAGVVGFVGNELVAIYRIRVGRRIGSAALVADGVHARADGFTSLAVVLGAVGVMLGVPLADPIVGLVISAAIIVLLVGAARSVGARLMDAVDPHRVDLVEAAIRATPGVVDVSEVRLRWVGHRLQGSADVVVEPDGLAAATVLARAAEHAAQHAMPSLDRFDVRPGGPREVAVQKT
jgi:cation diffusion facilitator family transporter